MVGRGDRGSIREPRSARGARRLRDGAEEGAALPLMGPLRVGNAPCSWGTLEFEETKAEPIGFSRMLDELVETGYTGTELGDWGYMPTDAATLSRELNERGLVTLGAFVPVALKEPQAHEDGIAAAVKIGRASCRER